MRLKIGPLVALLALIIGACNLTQSPVIVTDTPVTSAETPIPTVTIINTPLPTMVNLSVVASPALLHIDFLDANNGWGIASNDGGDILRSVDGGVTWLNVTPSDLTDIGYSTDLSILDANTAWVLVPNSDFFTGTLYHTSDGGLSWKSMEVPFGGGILQFLDANTGRMLADRGAGAGSQAVEIFQTSDGGESWLSVYNNDPTRPDASNTLPLSGIKNGMTFLDANVGWVTGTRPVDGEVYLFVTHDGGISWVQQNISLPAGFESYQYMPGAPFFFGNDGYLPLTIYMPNLTEFAFYTTHDGGAKWNGDPTNANQVISPGPYTFSDALHGWSWNGGNDMFYTSDGAQTWVGMSASLDLKDWLSQLEFASGLDGTMTGWALTTEDNAGHSQLYKTTDNGATWTLLIP